MTRDEQERVGQVPDLGGLRPALVGGAQTTNSAAISSVITAK